MPVALTFDSQDAIPEPLKPHAVERDGKWIFEAETLQEVGNLKTTLKKERDGRTKYEAELKKLERFKPLAEADDDERDQFLDAWEKRKSGKPDEKSQLDLKLHEKQLKKKEDELAKTNAELDKARKSLKDYELWTPLRDIAIKSGLVAEDWELARLELSNKNQFGFDDEGKIVVLEDGHPSSVSPDKFFKEMYSEQRPKFYKASGAGGSGASAGAGNGASKTIKRSAFDQLNASDKMQRVKDGYVLVD